MEGKFLDCLWIPVPRSQVLQKFYPLYSWNFKKSSVSALQDENDRQLGNKNITLFARLVGSHGWTKLSTFRSMSKPFNDQSFMEPSQSKYEYILLDDPSQVLDLVMILLLSFYRQMTNVTGHKPAVCLFGDPLHINPFLRGRELSISAIHAIPLFMMILPQFWVYASGHQSINRTFLNVQYGMHPFINIFKNSLVQ